MKSKIQTYLGFAKKSNAIVYGLDNLEKYFKKNCLVLYSNNLSENSLNKLSRLVAERKWKMGVLKNQTIDELLFVDNCKIIGITNENLARAIVLNGNDAIQLFD